MSKKYNKHPWFCLWVSIWFGLVLQALNTEPLRKPAQDLRGMISALQKNCMQHASAMQFAQIAAKQRAYIRWPTDTTKSQTMQIRSNPQRLIVAHLPRNSWNEKLYCAVARRLHAETMLPIHHDECLAGMVMDNVVEKGLVNGLWGKADDTGKRFKV